MNYKTNTQEKNELRRFDVLVSNGYDYEYEDTITATSVHDARKQWSKRGDWKTLKFKVRRAN